MILGYGELAQALEGLYTLGSLMVLDCNHKLPLTRQWHEGKRAFDPMEVARLKVETMAKRQQRKVSTSAACGQ